MASLLTCTDIHERLIGTAIYYRTGSLCQVAERVEPTANAAFFGGVPLRSLIPSLRGPEAACVQGERRLGLPSDDSLISEEKRRLREDFEPSGRA